MRILQLLLRDTVGGAESVAKALDEEFRMRGCIAEIRFLDPPGTMTKRPLNRLKRLRMLYGGAEQPRYDVVFAQTALPILYAAASHPRNLALIAVLQSAHDDYQDIRLRYAQRLLLGRIDATVAVSSIQAAEYVGRYPMTHTTVRVIENCVDTSRFRPAPVAIQASPLRLLTATRLVPWKRVELAIAGASELVRKSGCSVHLSILGDGDPVYVAQLRDKAANCAIEGLEIEFLGESANVDNVMRRSHALVHCSKAEGFSVALVEGASSGLILVVSDLLESVPKGAILRRFSDGDATSLAATLSLLASDLRLATDSARVAATVVSETYSAATAASKYLAVAQEAIDMKKERVRS